MKYAGIGSRDTPILVQYLFTEIGRIFGSNKILLRSGRAFGADFAFEIGCDEVYGKKEIFIPWKGFNQANDIVVEDPYYISIATDIASNIHPEWDKLSFAAKKLHTRNIYQIAGAELNDPVDFVLCWTKNSADVGGTRTAIVFARDLKIPVYNFGNFQTKLHTGLLEKLSEASEESGPSKIFSVLEKFLVDKAMPLF